MANRVIESVRKWAGVGAGKILKSDAGGLSDWVDLGQQISSSSGSFSTGSTSFVDVTNLSVTITTTGRPVMLMLISDGTVDPYYCHLEASDGSSATAIVGFQFLRGVTVVCQQWLGISVGGTTSTITEVPVSSMSFIDVVVAGTYTYKMQASAKVSGRSAMVYYAKLVAFEL